jgi:hypothetical protein
MSIAAVRRACSDAVIGETSSHELTSQQQPH